MSDRTGEMVDRVSHKSIWEAVGRARHDGVPPSRKARSAFVIDDDSGHVFPAKYILGLAHEIETGEVAAPDRYTSEPRLWVKLVAAGLRFKREQPSLTTVVTVAVEGEMAQTIDDNIEREDLLLQVRDVLIRLGWAPTLILFPGGFFHLPTHLGPLSFAERRRLIETQAFDALATQVASTLNCVVVAGVDTESWLRPGLQEWDQRDFADQLCAAWDCDGLTGIGRKVFPTTESGVDSGEAAGYVVYPSDLGTERRLVPIGKRTSALLCSCYDMFGCTERPDHQRKRSRQIRWLANDAGGLIHRTDDRKAFRTELTALLAGWQSLVEDTTVGLAAIHYFSKSGAGSGISYWERHGVQTASRVLGGQLAFGAYHCEALPAPDASVMAAANGRRLAPRGHLTLTGTGIPSALIRRFEVWS